MLSFNVYVKICYLWDSIWAFKKYVSHVFFSFKNTKRTVGVLKPRTFWMSPYLKYTKKHVVEIPYSFKNRPMGGYYPFSLIQKHIRKTAHPNKHSWALARNKLKAKYWKNNLEYVTNVVIYFSDILKGLLFKENRDKSTKKNM